MANTIRLKRRASGAAGSPAALKSAEVAYNEVDDILYYGKGDDGSGNATTIIVIAGLGAMLALTGNQTAAGVKTFSSSPIGPTPATNDNSTKLATTAYVVNKLASAGAGDMTKAVYDTLDNGTVNSARAANTLASGATGVTPIDASNNTVVPTTAWVKARIAELIASAPGALDTLNELAAAMGNDANFAASVSTALAGKADLVLGNLSNAGTARTNLGLGSMALQAASGVAITGGTIDNVTLDGGTF